MCKCGASPNASNACCIRSEHTFSNECAKCDGWGVIEREVNTSRERCWAVIIEKRNHEQREYKAAQLEEKIKSKALL